MALFLASSMFKPRLCQTLKTFCEPVAAMKRDNVFDLNWIQRIQFATQKRPMRNSYLAICSNFRYPRELGTAENYRKNESFVSKHLNKTKSINQVTSPSLKKLIVMIDENPIIRMLIGRMSEEAYAAGNISHNYGCEWFICRLQDILYYAPVCNIEEPSESVTLPLAACYGPLADTESGEALALSSEMNTFWNEYLSEYCDFLSSSDSAHVLNSTNGWLSPSGYEYMKLDDYIIPENGYQSWNDFFIRKLKPGVRTISSPHDNSVFTSAVDAQLWNFLSDIKEDSEFWIKSQPYHILTLLNNDKNQADYYLNGTILQCVLWTEDYHRWHAPVEGIITKCELVTGTYFTNLPYKSELDTTSLQYWTGSMPYMAHLNTRMIIEIDTSVAPSEIGNIGKITFIAVGLNEVSSVIGSVKTGDYVKKGDELGYFQFGGSTIMYIFPQGAINEMNVTCPNDPFEEVVKVQLGDTVATLNKQVYESM